MVLLVWPTMIQTLPNRKILKSMLRTRYYLISLLLFLICLYAVLMLRASVDLDKVIAAVKIIVFPALVCLLVMLLLPLSLYLLYKGNSTGRVKKHVRFR
ncbi:hypothetical protein N824_05180 [Pedobacter sp. V48]|nr:hypothetical protein N824_05180 [Pedobacter sp. V48]